MKTTKTVTFTFTNAELIDMLSNSALVSMSDLREMRAGQIRVTMDHMPPPQRVKINIRWETDT